MKFILVVLVAVVVAAAEPPRYRQQNLQRQEEAPYPASGYRPQGAQFRLPSRVQALPQKYGPPEGEEASTTESDAATTTEEPDNETTEKSQRQKQNEKLVDGEEKDAEEVEVENEEKQNDQPQQQGIYYILLPTGQLQKVQYLTTGNVAANAAYTTQLQYEQVQPISGPIYSIGPNGQIVQIYK